VFLHLKIVNTKSYQIELEGVHFMNILFVYPEFPDTFWSYKHALKFIRKKAVSQPLGLITVAAMLPKEWNKKLVDVNVTSLKDKDILWADYVFISAMIVQRDSARQIIDRCKALGVKVVAGGPLFTLEPEKFDDVDHLVLNEAEITLAPFLEDLKQGKPKHIYSTAGLDPVPYADLHTTPAPLWDLIDIKNYSSINIQFTRGCPFNCDFCNVTALLGHKVRTKSTEQMIQELDSLYATGYRGSVFFVDDNFIGNKRILKQELLPALIEWRKGKKGITFSTEASINLADDEELMELMTEAGFEFVFVGIETPEEEALSSSNKNQNKKRNLLEDVKKIQRAGLEVKAGFIVGFDSDTVSTFHRQIEFIQKSGIVTAMVGLLQAPPGTKLYQRLAEEGRIISQMTGDNVDGTTNIIPKMNKELLLAGYRNIMGTIYSPKHYYERVKTFLREYKAPKIRLPIDFNSILALLRTIIRLGILGKERLYYWNLVFWTIFHRPELFPQAITMSVYGYHYRTICEKRNII